MSKAALRLLVAGLLSVAATGSAFAHATLETTEAPPDSTYKGVIRIGHGCEGKPTQAVRSESAMITFRPIQSRESER